jgi:prepilin-type N-terminal cleavage/methylation domain-containing protein
MSRRLRARAVTLIELIVAAAVMAIVALFTVPTYQLILAQAQLSSATNLTVEQIRLQVQRTVSEQQIYGFSARSVNTVVAYQVCQNLACTSTTNSNYTVGPGVIASFLCRNVACTAKDVALTTLPVNVVVDSTSFGGQTDVRFSTAGAPSTSGSLVLRDTIRNRRRQIDLRPSGAILPGSREY